MTHPRNHFADSYTEARQKFLAAAKNADAVLGEYRHPLPGPCGEALFTDTALLGNPNAEQLVIVSSGVHGVEGFCGSACQVALLHSGLLAGAKSYAILLVHALNPFGFAHLRRTNEDNVDLNRNFVDHAHPPTNGDYERLHTMLVPEDWDGPLHIQSELKLLTLMARTDMRSVYALASRGQYTHPDGLFYGGNRPVWSNFTWRQILSDVVVGRNAIFHLDLHSGLGRFGYGELMFVGTAKTPGFNALGACLSEPLLPIFDDAAVAPPVDGPLMRALQEGAGNAHLIPFVLEFGTLCLPAVLRAMRIDSWLNRAGRPANSMVQSLRAEVRAAFYVDDDRWRSMVIDQAVRHGRELIHAIEAGISFS
jgi:hypothetical protein